MVSRSFPVSARKAGSFMVAMKAVRGLIAGLENEGVIKFSDEKIVEYKIPKRKK